jgi:FKBP-type peptidyl-prolyl cis-trans isomerase SlpA
MHEDQTLVIEPGSEVEMLFSITLEDGTVADSTEDGEPLRFVMGDGTLIQGLELALYGLKAGDRQSVSIGPETAFGFRDDEAVRELPRGEFPPDIQPSPGVIIGFSTPTGDEVPGAVLEVGDEWVKIDFNHPLAGHEIRFDVEIVAVRPPQPDAG